MSDERGKELFLLYKAISRGKPSADSFTRRFHRKVPKSKMYKFYRVYRTIIIQLLFIQT